VLVEVVDSIAAGTAHEEEQDDSQATYAPKITREESRIDWTRSALAIHNQVRGLNPWPRASTSLDGARLIVMRTFPEEIRLSAGTEVPAPHPQVPGLAADVEPELPFRRPPPGTGIEAAGDAIRVVTGDGVILILALQPEGRRAMTAREFLAGRPIAAGTRFS
jgi:methionyl-tRNA formyltransferase